jgi:hypothetical protein
MNYDYYQQMPDYDQKLMDLSGVAPVMQNTSGQNSMMQNNTNSLTNLSKAAYNPKGDVAPYDASAMAKLLRQSKDEQSANQPAKVYDYSQPMPDAMPSEEEYQAMMQKYYGNTYDPNAGWSD